MSTAKTNRMKSSITHWNQISSKAPDEENRPCHKTCRLPPVWQSYEWQDIPTFHLCTSTDLSSMLLSLHPPDMKEGLEAAARWNVLGGPSWEFGIRVWVTGDTLRWAAGTPQTLHACGNHSRLCLCCSSRNSAIWMRKMKTLKICQAAVKKWST